MRPNGLLKRSRAHVVKSFKQSCWIWMQSYLQIFFWNLRLLWLVDDEVLKFLDIVYRKVLFLNCWTIVKMLIDTTTCHFILLKYKVNTGNLFFYYVWTWTYTLFETCYSGNNTLTWYYNLLLWIQYVFNLKETWTVSCIWEPELPSQRGILRWFTYKQCWMHTDCNNCWN